MIFIGIFILSWLAGLIIIDWKKWRIGYHTALFGSWFAFIINTTFVSGFGFWSYSDSLLPGLWPVILNNISLYPVGLWIYVQRFPQKRVHQIFWILFGDAALILIEAFHWFTHHIHYHHGWNLGFSCLSNLLLLLLMKRYFEWIQPNKSGS